MVRRASSGRPTRSTGGRAARGRPARRRESDDDEIPEVYREMLAEADARASNQPETEDRPLKRRRVGERRSVLPELKSEEQAIPPSEADENVGRQLQTAYDSAASDDSDMEWEEVEIHQPVSDALQAAASGQGDEPLQITLDKPTETRKTLVARRKPVSAAEKKLRLDVHKVHLLCLLSHVQRRNLWCNDDEVQGFLKRMLSKQTIAFLNPKESMPQFTRSTTFIDGLKQASETFSKRFKVTVPGLKRPYWAEDPKSLKDRAETLMSGGEAILSKDDFRKQARTLQGSRDFGAQLFCALLRSVSVETRLVCSLQPLPFSGAAKGTTPVKQGPQFIVISSDDHESSTEEKSRPQTPAAATPQPARIRRIGQPQFTQHAPRKPQTSPRAGPSRSTQESSFPVFWVEAFNEAVQKWIPVDPLVTKSVAKPSKFEPPASDRYNSMTYVIAFEDDASARDVTRRYTKAYNAKTIKNRVESTKDGEKWWTETMRFFEKPFMEDRDQVEISELTAKSGAEQMPKNIQDFKDHPVYALERHLRRNEVIYPKRVIGQVALSKPGSKNQVLEPVYRRADVHTVRSADGWFRLGRDIKVGEQPLKRVTLNRNKAARFNADDEDPDEPVETPLYAAFQTEPYKPPPVVNGKVPKNAYGNLDVYVPSMVPPGGFHLKHPEAARAARILGIDYADAVTGFDFKGRHGTAIFEGIVAANEYREALEAVLKGLEDERIQAELERKSEQALRLWKLFLVKLRIAERVKGYAVEGEEADDEGSANPDDEDDEGYEDSGGGFFPEPGQEIAQPTANTGAAALSEQSAKPDYSQSGSDLNPKCPVTDADDSLGGGFLPDTSTDGAAEPHSSSYGAGKSLGRWAKGTPKSAKNHQRYTLVVVPSDNTKDKKPADTDPNVQAPSNPSHQQVEQDTAPTGPGTREDVKGSQEAPIIVDSSSGEKSKSASVEVISRPQSEAESRAQSPEPVEEESDSNLEERSLLSHDPEDEDAEPEWLLSD